MSENANWVKKVKLQHQIGSIIVFWNTFVRHVSFKEANKNTMNYQTILDTLYNEVKSEANIGEIAAYIPELAKVDADKFGICLLTNADEQFKVGDADEKFSIQSVSKIFSLSLAYSMLDGKLWERVGVEPSGNAFNSLVQLEYDRGIPRNPFINAGAIVVCDVLQSILKHPKQEMLDFIRTVADNPKIDYSRVTFNSELEYGYRNIAMVNFIKSFGNIHNNVQDVLDLYFMLCSVEMTCAELSKAALYFANNGVTTTNAKQILTRSQSKRLNALMLTCGFYDESGDFAYKVGLPGKSGVGGGILAVYPENYTIAVWSPVLNSRGNSYRGFKFLEAFTTATNLSIF
jgi:glutaminase